MNDFEISETVPFAFADLLETPLGLFSKKKYMNGNVRCVQFTVFSIPDGRGRVIVMHSEFPLPLALLSAF